MKNVHYKVKLLAALLVLSGNMLQAQTAPSATTPPASSEIFEGDDDGIVTITPFEVRVDTDQGYTATNTLAGSRINSNIKDTPATIAVFTTEFLSDIGATDLGTVLNYGTNSQLDFGDTQRGFNGTESIATGSTRFRSRGISASLARNYFKTNLNPEFYIIDRLDESRGPNAILFGVGAPGGILNIGTKEARLNKTATTLGTKIDNNSLEQYTLDHNQVIVKNVLGLRLNAMYQDKGSWRFNENSSKKGIQGAIKWTPLKDTSIRASIETGERTSIAARNWTIRDGVSAWWDNPQTTPVLGQANAPITGVALAGNRKVYIENSGLLLNQNNTFWQSTQNTSSQNLINNPARVPYEVNAAGPGARANHDYNIYSVTVEQKIAEHLFAEISYQHERGKWKNYDAAQDFGGVDNTLNLRGDPNEFFAQSALLANLKSTALTSGTASATPAYANPDKGGYYIDTAWRRRIQESTLDNLRASLAYEFDLGQLGSHRLAAMVQQSKNKNSNADEHEYFVGPNASDADAFVLWRRNYVTLGDAANFYAADWASRPTISYTDTNGSYTNDWRAYSPYAKSEETDTSALLAMQSYFLQRRLVTTLGYRYDTADSDRFLNEKSTGFYQIDPTRKVSTTRTANTYSGGAVYHLTSDRSFSLFANASSNIDLPDFNIRYGPDGGIPPNRDAKTFDAGIMIDLVNGKLNGRITYFDTKSKFETQNMGINNTFAPNYNAIMLFLENPDGNRATNDGLYTPDMLAQYPKLRASAESRGLDIGNALPNGDSLNNSTKGLEANFNLNPTKNLQFSVKYSYTIQDKTNAYTETLPRYQQLVQLIQDIKATNPTLTIPATGTAVALTGVSITSNPLILTPTADPLGTLINAINGSNTSNGIINGISNKGSLTDRTFDFLQANGGRKHKANLFGKYSFRGSSLDGFSFGGGVRYQSKILAGALKDPTAPSSAGGTPVYGSELFYLDALLAYNVKLPTALFGRNMQLNIQLNIRNVLNEQGIIRMRYNDTAETNAPYAGQQTLNRFILETPREYVLSADFKF